MKRISKYLIATLFLLICHMGKGQLIERLNKNFQEYNRKYPQENIIVHTDKDIYIPGGDIWYKAYIYSNTESAKPVSSDLFILITGINGEIVAHQRVPVNDNMVDGYVSLPANTENGIYTMCVFTGWMKNLSCTEAFCKKIIISKTKSAKIETSANFSKELYSPGDTVVLSLQLPNEMTGVKLNYSVNDMKGTLKKIKTMSDSNSRSEINFVLPDKTDNNIFYIVLETEVNNKTYYKTFKIPLVPDKINIRISPETDKIIAGIDNKVYIKLSDSYGFPVNIKARVVDSQDKTIAPVYFNSDGIGSFSLNPVQGVKYFVVLDNGQKEELPPACSDGIGLMYRGISKQKLNFILSPSKETEGKNVNLLITKNNLVVYAAKYILAKSAFVQIPDIQLPKGIVKVTAISDEAEILASRDIYIPGFTGNNNISSDNQSYSVMEEVKLTVNLPETKDHEIISYSLSVASEDSEINNFKYSQYTSLNSKVYDNLSMPGSIEEYIDLLLITEEEKYTLEEIINYTYDKSPVYTNFKGISGQIQESDYKYNSKVKAINPLMLKTYSAVSDKNGYFNIELGDDIVDLQFLTFSAVDETGKKTVEFIIDDSYIYKLINKIKIDKDKRNINKIQEILAVYNPNRINNKKYRMPKKITNRQHTKMSNQLYYAQFTDTYELLGAMKQYDIVDNKIVFKGMTQTISSLEGAHIILDGQYLRDDSSVLSTVLPGEIENIEIITDFAEMQRYGSFITTAVIKIDTKKTETYDINKYKNHLNKKEFIPLNKAGLKNRSEETTLLWVPDINSNKSNHSFSFYTSSIKGNYIARLVGVDIYGNMFIDESSFSVQ